MSKKVLLALTLGIMLGVTGLAIHQQRASAISWGTGCLSSAPSPYNIHYCVGYFTGNYVTNYNSAVDVFPYGLHANSGNFVSEIESYLLGADPTGNHGCVGRWTQCEAGAAFIIETMLGHGPFSSGVNAGISQANSDLSSWVSLVNGYINSPPPGYSVNFNGGVDCQPGGLNSGWFTALNDDAFHGADCALDSTTEIVFSWPGGTFEIGQDCGNVDVSAGQVHKVQVPPSPWGNITLLCNNSTAQYSATVNFGDNNGFATSGSISTNGWSSGVGSGSTTPIPTSVTSPYSSQSVTLTVSDNGTQAQYSASTPAPCIGSPSCSFTLTSSTSLIDPYTPFSVIANVTYNPSQAPPTPPSMNLAINNPSGAQAYNSSQNVNGNSPTSVTFSISALANGTGNYTANGTLTSQYFNTITCNTTIPVVNLPYLQVYGGDTMIGTSPDASTLTCDQSQSAGIYSWNRNGSPDYSGAGDQFAVQTLGQINGYASAQSSTSSPPVGLSLANTVGVKQGQGLFGGSSGTGLASSDCDFTSDLNGLSPQAGNTVSVPSSVGGSDTIYATGNVYIGNNVIYNGTGGWANVSDIPYFKLIVVGGNIYIGSNVTELDGLYVAEPLGGNGGTIFTCATGGLPSPAYSPSGTGAIPNYYSTCNKQLTIDGSFVAQQVEFLRTYGTAGQADYNGHSDSVTSNYAGEVFDYTPEMWLPRDNSSPSDSYTAITGLPPEL